MFCWHCGAQVPDQALFCPKCGKSLTSNAPKEPERRGPGPNGPIPEPPPKSAWGAAANRNPDPKQKRSDPSGPEKPSGSNKELAEAKKRLMGVLIGLAVILAVGFGKTVLDSNRRASAGNLRPAPSPSASAPSPSPSPSSSASAPSPLPSPSPSASVPSPSSSASAAASPSASSAAPSPEQPADNGTYIGTYTYKNGPVYEGEMKDGLPNGYGVITYSKSALGLKSYEGHVVDGLRDGRGAASSWDGSAYEGGWKDDKRHGDGIDISPDGTELYGEWVNGRKEGTFTRTTPDGTVYIQEYQNGELVSSVETGGGSSTPSVSPKPSASSAPSASPKPSASAKPADTELLIPDFGAFCGGDVNFYLDEKGGTTSWKKGYEFKPNSTVVEEYLALLESDYKFSLEKTRSSDVGNSAITYGYAYTGTELVSSVDQTFKWLECEISVTQWDDHTRIVIRYGYQLNYTDSGERTTAPTEAYGASGGGGGGSSSGSGGFTPDASKLPCLTCNGSGDCPTCGGDGYLFSSASGKEDRNCWRCGSNRGRCPTCNGSKYR